ncbi:hypothetical protein ACJIZ3_006570 [Penstemon smallii]|uniref:Uncharacterized protein n=1 Tax=Penstemon smallii TaxID=265156 RepID=A0ABD3S821_9LAMI
MHFNPSISVLILQFRLPWRYIIRKLGSFFSIGGNTTGIPPEIGAPKRHHRFPDLKRENNRKSVEALVKSTGKESMQWGLAAGMYSGLTYSLKEARRVHDWVMQCAITGAAVSTAANLLTGIF